MAASKKPETKGAKTTPVLKAKVTEISSTSTALDKLHEAIQRQTGIDGVLTPPYNPEGLARLAEGSAILPQYVDAIATNVDSFGHNYIPTLDFGNLDIRTRLADAIEVERLEDVKIDDTTLVETISEKDIDAVLHKTRISSKIELNKLRRFFGACCPDYSFIELRMRTRQEQLITGNAYWEILRNKRGEPSRLVLASTITMRLLPRDDAPVTITEWTQISEIKWVKIPQQRFFRRFTEINPKTNTPIVYFKEFQDPRCISRKTGQIFVNEKAFEAAKTKGTIPIDDLPASEILHFSVPALTTPYGVPQWIGNLPAVLGSRELDEVNLAYFENKTVPPLALLVSGGRLARGVVPRLEEFIESQVKGKRNFHKILIVEAEGQKTAGGTSGIAPAMKFVPLREAQQQDAQFQVYDERNWDKLASSFRLPRMLVGRDRAINRATALAAMRFGEEQVFEPIRNQFDALINRRVLPELGVFFWTFRSKTPTTRDPELLAEVIGAMADTGAFTGREIRQLAQDVFNHEFPEVDAPWANEPFKLFLAGLQGEKKVATEKRAAARIQNARDRMDAEGVDPGDEGHNSVKTAGKNGTGVSNGAAPDIQESGIELPGLGDDV
jgi:PBSX family phage portal protein